MPFYWVPIPVSTPPPLQGTPLEQRETARAAVRNNRGVLHPDELLFDRGQPIAYALVYTSAQNIDAIKADLYTAETGQPTKGPLFTADEV